MGLLIVSPKVNDDHNVLQPWNVAIWTFLALRYKWASEAAKVMVVVSYFWRGYQQPSDIDLSDGTSVVPNTPPTLWGQAFLGVSRHTHPSHHNSLSFCLSHSLSMLLYEGWPTLGVGGWTWICVDVCSGVSVGLEAGLQLSTLRAWQAKSRSELSGGGPDCWAWGWSTEGPLL